MRRPLEKNFQSYPHQYSTTLPYKNFLRCISLFCEFSESSLNEMLAHTRIKRYTKNNILFMTGDRAEYFHIITQGFVKLYRQTRDGHESVLSILTERDIFGKAAILNNGIYAYSAESISDVEMLSIPAAFMLKMAQSRQDYDHFLSKFLETELNEINQLGLHAEHLGQMTSAERVGCFLLRMCGARENESATFMLPYEKSLMAGRLGMTAETFSRCLSQLSMLGVETKNSEVTIYNLEQLQAHICERCSATRAECVLGAEIDTH